MMKQEVLVSGMTCGGCANTVEKRFSGIPSVEAVEINLDQKKVTLTVKDHVGDDELIAALEGTAYSIEK